MKIVIISDIHDNVWNLQAALYWLGSLQGDEAVQELICCGDLCSPFVLGLLANGFPGPIHAVAGNNEGDWRHIMINTAKANQERRKETQITFYGQFFEGEFGGKRIAVNHYPEIARAIAATGKYDLVCFGHNHMYEMRHFGSTLALNPGTLMGYNPLKDAETRDVEATFAIYDTSVSDDQAVRFYEVTTPWHSGTEPGRVILFERVKETGEDLS